MVTTWWRRCADFLQVQARFILSCRARDYRDDLAPLRAHSALEQLYLRDLEPPQIRAVACRRLGEERGAALWGALGGSEPLLSFWQKVHAQAEGDRFWDAKARVPSYTSGSEYAAWRGMHGRLLPLCRNPFLLGIACDVYEERGALPGSRAALFAEFVGTLLGREAEQAARRGEPWPADDRIEQATGTRCHRDAGSQGDGASPCRGSGCHGPRRGNAAEGCALRKCAAGRGGARALRPSTASGIFRGAPAAGSAGAVERWNRSHGTFPTQLFGPAWWEGGVWREMTVMLGEVVGVGEGEAGVNRVVRWLAGASPEVALEVLLRNGEGLTLADVEPETRAALVASARAKAADRDPRGRAAAYRVLARLDADDRPGVGLRPDGVPDIAWVRIAGGRYRIGGDGRSLSSPCQNRRWSLRPSGWRATRSRTGSGKRSWGQRMGTSGTEWWEGLAGGKQKPEAPRWTYGNHPRETCELVRGSGVLSVAVVEGGLRGTAAAGGRMGGGSAGETGERWSGERESEGAKDTASGQGGAWGGGIRGGMSGRRGRRTRGKGEWGRRARWGYMRGVGRGRGCMIWQGMCGSGRVASGRAGLVDIV